MLCKCYLSALSYVVCDLLETFEPDNVFFVCMCVCVCVCVCVCDCS